MKLKFSDRAQGASPTLTMDMVNRIPAGLTLASATVTAELYDESTTNDSSPSAILSGAAQVSGTKVLQQVTGGVVGATYVLTFKPTFSDTTTDIVQATQTVAKYVP